jgi:O-antigen/teichoic acid export membrane protein
MLTRHFSVYLLAHILPAVIGFAAITLYTRLLSPADYGVYIVGLSIAGIYFGIFFVWIRLSVSRYQASHASVDFSGTAVVAFGLTLAAIVVVTPFVLLVGRDIDPMVLGAAVLTAVANGGFEIAQEFMRATLRPMKFATIAIVRAAFALALGLCAVLAGFGGVGLLTAVGFSYLIGCILNVTTSGAKFSRADRQHLAQFARYGLPMSLGGLSVAIYSTIDRLLVAYYLGADAAGHFGVAAELPRQFLVILGSSVAAATFPVVFRCLTAEGAAATRAKLNDNAELLLAVVLPVVVWLVMTAPQIAGTLVGAEFRSSVALLLPVVALARLVNIINQFYVQISFQLAERSGLGLIQSTSTLLLSLVLTVVLLSNFGLVGAAWAALLAETIGVIIGIVLTRWAFPLPFDAASLSRVIACALVMAAAIYGARLVITGTGFWSLVGLSAAGGLAYALAAVALNVVRIRETLRSLAATLPRRRSPVAG